VFFPLADGYVAGSFLISPSAEADFFPQGKQEKLYPKQVLAVVFLTQGFLQIFCPGAPM